MTEKILTVRNRAGIHARPAALIAQTANKFACEVTMIKDDAEVNAKSIMGVITMASIFILLVLISAFKEISSAPLVSMLCAYYGATFISKAKQTKDKTDILTGIMFTIAMVLNTIAFIIK